MSTWKELFSIGFHSIDDNDGSSAYQDGEVEWCITKELRAYIEKYGWEGIKNIMAEIASVTYEIMHTQKLSSHKPEEKSKQKVI